MLIHLRHGAVKTLRDRIRRIDNPRGVGIGNVDCVDRRHIAHKGQVLAISREIQSQFRFRGEAGDHLVLRGRHSFLRAVRHLKRGKKRTGRSDLIEEHLRRNTEAAIDETVVPNVGISSVADRGPTRASAVGRQRRTDHDVVRIVVVDAATDDEVTRPEVCAAILRRRRTSAHQS